MSTILTIFLIPYDIKLASWFYVAKYTIFMFLRFVDYKQKKWHYLLIEFCYFVNLMLMFYIVFHSMGYRMNWMFRDLYGLAHGPLAFATLFFGDKLVFHHLQHFISIFVHLAPLLVTTGIRWFDHDNYFGIDNGVNGDWMMECKTNLFNSGWIYLIWAFVYYIIMFWILDDRIQQKCNMTLYRYIVKDKSVTGSKKLDELIYMISHALLNMSTILFSGLLWNDQALNIIFTFFICAMGVYRAESFYRAKLLKNK